MKKQLLIASMLLGLSGLAVAGGPHDGEGMGYHHGLHEKRGERMYEMLDLSAEQRQSVQQIHEQYREQMRSQMKDRGPRQGTFMDLDPEDPNYEQQVQALAKSHAEAAEQRILLGAEKHAKIYAVLTEEQREKLKELHAQRKE